MAIFVEGQTEIIFVSRLLHELAGQENVRIIEEKKERGRYLVDEKFSPNNEKYELLVVNCGNDEEVLSSIIERYTQLVDAGFSLIVGLRDLYPKSLVEYDRLTAGINSMLPIGPSPCFVVVAKAEVESWFVQEQLHYPIVDQTLSRANIINQIGCDIDVDLAECLAKPSAKLNEIYMIAGKRYRKRWGQVSNIVYSLDMENLYLDRRGMLTSFDAFVALIEGFIQ